jgi:competence protein ComEC
MFSYRYFTIIILLILTGLSIYIYKWEYRKPLFEVVFFSLNRGRAIFIRSPENKTFLIGGGQNSDTIRELTKVIPFYSKKIDYVFIPSALPTQIGGLMEIVDRYDINEIIMPEVISTSTVLTKLMNQINKKKIHIEKMKRGDSIEIGSLSVKVFFPDIDFKYNKTSLPELGISLEYGSTGLYLFGNLSKTIQKDILKNIDIMTTQNLIEFYNSAIKTKLYDSLIDALKPEFIFSTKEKTTRWVSNGFSWEKDSSI